MAEDYRNRSLKSILSLDFPESDAKRAAELNAKANEGLLAETESEEHHASQYRGLLEMCSSASRSSAISAVTNTAIAGSTTMVLNIELKGAYCGAFLDG